MKKVYYLGNTVSICTCSNGSALEESAETVPFKIDVRSLGEEAYEMLKITNLIKIFETAKSVVFMVASELQESELWEVFQRQFVLIGAGGGVVRSRSREILLIYRNGKWDLPKGKREKDEDIEACALREVREECGLSELISQGEIRPTYHIYSSEGLWVLKRTDWFLMTYTGQQVPVPQAEEGITDVRWVLQDNIASYLETSYPNIREVIADVQ